MFFCYSVFNNPIYVLMRNQGEVFIQLKLIKMNSHSKCYLYLCSQFGKKQKRQ